jgi:hypothetical protein
MENAEEKKSREDDMDRREAADVERAPLTAEDVANMRVFHDRDPTLKPGVINFEALEDPLLFRKRTMFTEEDLRRIRAVYDKEPISIVRKKSPSGENGFQKQRSKKANPHHNVVRLMQMERYREEPFRLEFLQESFHGPVSLVGYSAPTSDASDLFLDSERKEAFDAALQTVKDNIKELLTFPREF